MTFSPVFSRGQICQRRSQFPSLRYSSILLLYTNMPVPCWFLVFPSISALVAKGVMSHKASCGRYMFNFQRQNEFCEANYSDFAGLARGQLRRVGIGDVTFSITMRSNITSQPRRHCIYCITFKSCNLCMCLHNVNYSQLLACLIVII